MTQQDHITFFEGIFRSGRISTIPIPRQLSVSYFGKGSGQHLYVATTEHHKYLIRVNEYSLKNTWRIKEHEFAVLKMVEPLGIAPRAYYVDASGTEMNDHFSVIDFIEGNPISALTDVQVMSLAQVLKRLHTSLRFERPGNTFPPTDELPYTCGVFDEFANGEDKQIEKYSHLQGIEIVIESYNRVKKALGDWFHSLHCFDTCTNFCLCHADLKVENMLATPEGTRLIDWECAGSDIPETDIGRAFAGCRLTHGQEQLFLEHYFDTPPEPIVLERIHAVKKVLEFFRILEDYILHQRKSWNAVHMKQEIETFERSLKAQST